jgi:hypothetical protein
VKFGDFAFGQGHDLHASKAQMLEQRCYISLIARDAVQCFRKHNVEFAAGHPATAIEHPAGE